MTGCVNFPTPTCAGYDLSSNSTWEKLYFSLRPYVRHVVYSAGIAFWAGQEGDVIEDIIQEAIARTFKYARQVELRQDTPIASLEALSKVIAQNYFQDLRRRDSRLVRSEQIGSSPELHAGTHDVVDLSEVALNNMFLEKLFERLASEVVKFPYKQLTALLIDLANRMYFEVNPTPLQQAFLAVGIRFQDYRQSLPNDPVKHSRHASLASLGYKRVRDCMHPYHLV